MQITISGTINRFNLSEVKEDFINPCCFGEDFSDWLIEELNKHEVNADVICMEDFGWANQAEVDGNEYLVCVSGTSSEIESDPDKGEWIVTIEKRRSILERLTGKNKLSQKDNIVSIIVDIFRKNGFEKIKIEET